jgi:hypothetical protein
VFPKTAGVFLPNVPIQTRKILQRFQAFRFRQKRGETSGKTGEKPEKRL